MVSLVLLLQTIVVSHTYDIIAYTIFDTCSRTFRGYRVLNNKSKNFEVKLSLEVNGMDYIIHRTILKKERNDNGEVRRLCPVAVKFYVERMVS